MFPSKSAGGRLVSLALLLATVLSTLVACDASDHFCGFNPDAGRMVLPYSRLRRSVPIKIEADFQLDDRYSSIRVSDHERSDHEFSTQSNFNLKDYENDGNNNDEREKLARIENRGSGEKVSSCRRSMAGASSSQRHRTRQDRRWSGQDRRQNVVSNGRFDQIGGTVNNYAPDDDCNEESANVTKTIETAIFIDQALGNKFDGLSNGLVELNKLVLTIMNQVQYLFRYSSLKTPITIKIVLIEHLKEGERLGIGVPNAEDGDIDKYLSNFCNWQQSRLEHESRLWWDHAILLSGLDLYKTTPGKNHSGVLGFAWVGGMCKGNYSCTINEASNFESSFVIAHEIGHSLGIMHDGQRNRCDPNGFIMSERTGAGKIHWSRCSNSYLNESISKRQLNCLNLEQNGQVDSLYDLSKLRQPGQVYPINEQCKLAFGSNYSAYVTQHQPFNAVCRELWCATGTWAKAAHPALEGSLCASDDRFCREGKCVKL